MTLATLVGVALLRGFDRVFRLRPELHERYPMLEARANRYLSVLRSTLKEVFAALVALVLLEIWGAEPFEWLASDAGRAVVGRLISIGVVVLGGIALWEIVTAFAERMRRANPASTRLKTLLPFLQNAFRVVLLTLGGLILLSEIGVNIAPLLAGAGILGLAVGFGAQTLVKDVITGVFILMEDTLSVGDVVEVGSHSGLVEKISIRTLHMRDFDGNVHSIPFGEVQTIKNMSKEFAYAVVDVNVGYGENVDEALAVMAEVAADMAENGPLADTIVEPFEVVGVEGLQDFLCGCAAASRPVRSVSGTCAANTIAVSRRRSTRGASRSRFRSARSMYAPTKRSRGPSGSARAPERRRARRPSEPRELPAR